MVLSKRERVLAIATAVTLAALFVNSVIVDPVLDRRELTENEKLQLEAELSEANDLFERRRLLERKWKTMLSEGLGSEAEAESRVARALDEWSEDARLTLTSVKPEHAAGSNGMKEITFVLAGRGSLNAVAWFLYQIETAKLPVKVTDLQVGSSESGESMSLQLRLSAVYLGAEQTPSEGPSRPEEVGANDEQQLL